MKKISKVIYVLLIVLLNSCTLKYQYFEMEAKLHFNKNADRYYLVYSWNHEKSNNRIYLLDGIDYEKYNIDYILVGDVLKVKSDALSSDLTLVTPSGAWFNTVKNVKVNRAETKHFEVSEYETNGQIGKQITCQNENVKFEKSYTSSSQIVFTKQAIEEEPYDFKISFEYTSLKNLDVGTKLIGTVYHTDKGYGVYAFYLESIID